MSCTFHLQHLKLLMLVPCHGWDLAQIWPIFNLMRIQDQGTTRGQYFSACQNLFRPVGRSETILPKVLTTGLMMTHRTQHKWARIIKGLIFRSLGWTWCIFCWAGDIYENVIRTGFSWTKVVQGSILFFGFWQEVLVETSNCNETKDTPRPYR